MIDLTGNQALDMFIMESSRKKHKVLEILYNYEDYNFDYDNFKDFLNEEFNYKKSDFTDGDYMWMEDTWAEHQ